MIHYHGTPFSGELKNTTALAGHHAMVSFARPDALEIVAEVCQSFTLDNGAFSAWMKGETYDPDAFMKWAEVWVRHPGLDWAIIPDVIDGSEADNDALLSLAGDRDRWVPVWHLHESLDRLYNLASLWPRVAFGSSGQYAEIGTLDWWNRMAEALDLITDEGGFPLTKLHGLRMLDPAVFSYVPFSSADSTNVARNMGIDIRWTGPYVPKTAFTRALVIMDRIESHASANRWLGHHWQNNGELFP